MEMGDILDSGDCIVMAADRGAGREIEVPFDDGEITLQEGAFRLAHALEHPVYFIACVESAPWRYRAVARRISGNVREMACAYAAAFHSLTAAHPLQWFRWRGSK
jgi:lauroyl/myristoyl acyltransferase